MDTLSANNDAVSPNKSKLFYVINGLSVLRLILGIVIFVLILCNLKVLAFILFLIATITDTFDGKLARKYNVVSPSGKILDFFADGILMYFTLLALFIMRDLPDYVIKFFILVAVLAICFIIFRLILRKKIFLPPRRQPALLFAGCIYLNIAVLIIDSFLQFVFFPLTTLTFFITSIDYLVFNKE